MSNKRVGANSNIRYSEAFKLAVVRELERDDLPFLQIQRKYGIGGSWTVQQWVRKYGNGTRGRIIRVQKPEEIDELKRLKDRVRRLESALADAHVDLALERAFAEIACERAGIVDVGAFKKKSGWRAAHQALRQDGELSVSAVCRRLGMTRQNYYARRQHRQRRAVDEELVLRLVRGERQVQPRLGTRKLQVVLARTLAAAGVAVGRDRFFEVLRGGQLLVAPLPKEYPRTTSSYHCLPVFRNLIKARTLTRPNEVWVGDLTYLRTREGYLYLALLTDKYSRKIVGYHCGDTLEAEGCLSALTMALRELPAGARPIHHSDRGSQYCCHAYVNGLTDRGLGISMTEQDHCAENALAERINGILKGEYGLGGEAPTKAAARQLATQAVSLYNTRRPHTALAMRMPAEVHSLAA